jgi:GTP diphosphokinase / guanosine-3',5'-bis(diphosphate) 3'-diphosphatase
VEALDRSGLLSDISRALSDQHVDITAMSLTTSRDRTARIRFTIEMADMTHLGHVQAAVRHVGGVYDVQRVTAG